MCWKCSFDGPVLVCIKAMKACTGPLSEHAHRGLDCRRCQWCLCCLCCLCCLWVGACVQHVCHNFLPGSLPQCLWRHRTGHLCIAASSEDMAGAWTKRLLSALRCMLRHAHDRLNVEMVQRLQTYQD